MKMKWLFLAVLITPAFAQEKIEVTPAVEPTFCMGHECGAPLEDPTLEIEVLSAGEQKSLDAARKKAWGAQVELETLKSAIAKAHGDQPYSMSACMNEWTQTHAAIYGKYAYRTKEVHHPCINW